MPHVQEQNLRTIFLYRDPRDVIASQVNMRKFREGHRHGLPPFPNMTLPDILAWELEHYGPAYRDVLPQWVSFRDPQLLHIRYEQLVSDTRDQLVRAAKFLRLAADETLLNTIRERHAFERKAGRKMGEEDKASHYRKGIIGDFRNQFSGPQQTAILERLGPSLSQLGYGD